MWQENELQRPEFAFYIFLPLIFLPDLTSAIRRLSIFASEQESNCLYYGGKRVEKYDQRHHEN